MNLDFNFYNPTKIFFWKRIHEIFIRGAGELRT